jgi:hypothetical protein
LVVVSYYYYGTLVASIAVVAVAAGAAAGGVGQDDVAVDRDVAVTVVGLIVGVRVFPYHYCDFVV